MHKFDKNPRMFKYSILIAIVLVQACETAKVDPVSLEIGPYLAKNHQVTTDHAAAFMMAPYQNLLVGLNTHDTSYLRANATDFIHMNDSLASLSMPLDSNLRSNWVIGLQNINAELEGLLAAIRMNDPMEMKMSIHMTGLQFLHLLGQIGYKEQRVYIFNNADENKEDGYTWMGLQKNAKDPFHPQQKTPVVAVQLLEESK